MDEWLQTNLLHAGVLWHLILFVFQYDYTLDEGGVETSDDSNQQEVANNLARLSIEASAKLAGFKSKFRIAAYKFFFFMNCIVLRVTGPTGVAGYLTASSSSANSASLSAPPPLTGPPKDTPPEP